MYLKTLAYFRFLLKSTNQHGVHSPFVFDYLTKCIYSKPKKSKNKTINLLLKSIAYFSVKNVHVEGNTKLETQVLLNFSDKPKGKTPIDILYFETPSLSHSDQLFSNYPLQNNSLIIFNNIYQSFEELTFWNQFVKNKGITVSIDMFYCGLIFIRKEQVKQHFTIRI